MKNKKLFLAVLIVFGLMTASLNSNYSSASNNDRNSSWKKTDTTDNGGGYPIPPIGH